MKLTIGIMAALIASPAIAQTTYGSTNCYVAGRNITCQDMTQTTPAPEQRQRPAWQDMMSAGLQQSQNDWQKVAEMAARERLLKNCRAAAAANDTIYLNLNCR